MTFRHKKIIQDLKQVLHLYFLKGRFKMPVIGEKKTNTRRKKANRNENPLNQPNQYVNSNLK